MAKRKTIFVCQNCGYDAAKWMGKCPECGEWNTMVEEMNFSQAKKTTRERGVYSKPNRDPRGRVITFAYLAEADLSIRKAGDDAKELHLVSNWENEEIAFDHKQILNDALKLRK